MHQDIVWNYMNHVEDNLLILYFQMHYCAHLWTELLYAGIDGQWSYSLSIEIFFISFMDNYLLETSFMKVISGVGFFLTTSS